MVASLRSAALVLCNELIYLVNWYVIKNNAIVIRL